MARAAIAYIHQHQDSLECPNGHDWNREQLNKPKPELETAHKSENYPKFKFLNLPIELQSHTLSYLDPATVQELGKTDWQLWILCNRSLLVESKAWFRFNNGRFSKIHLSGALALLPTNFQRIFSDPSEFFQSPFEGGYDSSPTAVPQLSYDMRFARQVKRLYIEDRCLYKLAWVTKEGASKLDIRWEKDLEEKLGPERDYESCFLDWRQFQFLQVAFPRLQQLRCCCSMVQIDFKSKPQENHIKIYKAEPVQSIDDTVYNIPYSRSLLAKFHVWKAGLDFSQEITRRKKDYPRGSRMIRQKARHERKWKEKANYARQSLEHELLGQKPLHTLTFKPKGGISAAEIAELARLQLLIDLQDYCSLSPTPKNSINHYWPTHTALINLVTDNKGLPQLAELPGPPQLLNLGELKLGNELASSIYRPIHCLLNEDTGVRHWESQATESTAESTLRCFQRRYRLYRWERPAFWREQNLEKDLHSFFNWPSLLSN
jgi:hypothetical protein